LFFGAGGLAVRAILRRRGFFFFENGDTFEGVGASGGAFRLFVLLFIVFFVRFLFFLLTRQFGRVFVLENLLDGSVLLLVVWGTLGLLGGVVVELLGFDVL
jgi:hypothetical protein